MSETAHPDHSNLEHKAKKTPARTPLKSHTETAPRMEELPSFEALKGALEQQVDAIQRQFSLKHRHLLAWAEKQGYKIAFIAPSASRAMMAGGLMLSLLTSTPQNIAGLPTTTEAIQQRQLSEAHAKAQQVRAQNLETARQAAIRQQQQEEAIKAQLQSLVGNPAQMHDAATAQQVTKTINQMTGIPVSLTLGGYALNTNIGRIGAEQHLKRYPGDTVANHGSVQGGGMAPGLGAYGYFASSAATMTAKDVEREKYYLAIQTFKSPNWSGNVSATYNFFKYRKMLVYYPATGKAVVAVVGDAGPGLSTGKNYGGSPEVMAVLGARDGHGSPPAVMLFVDDPNDTIPLGPVNMQSLNLAALK